MKVLKFGGSSVANAENIKKVVEIVRKIEGEAIVVTARRSGAPMWTVETNRGTVLLVGEITEMPKATPWFPDRLEAATERAHLVERPEGFLCPDCAQPGARV